MHTAGRELNLLPKEPMESFWDALWLGIRPFFVIGWRNVVESCRDAYLSNSYRRSIGYISKIYRTSIEDLPKCIFAPVAPRSSLEARGSSLVARCSLPVARHLFALYHRNRNSATFLLPVCLRPCLGPGVVRGRLGPPRASVHMH